MSKFTVESVDADLVTLKVSGNNYRNQFKMAEADKAKVVAGKRVLGTIHAPAWKADIVKLGGNYVEPLFGRPRRMQGTVLAVNVPNNELTVHVGYDVTVQLPAKYKVADFPVGARIAWDNLEIPTLVLEG